MKILFIILILNCNVFANQFNDYIHNNYYCVTNDLLKTLVLDDDEYIFYGDYGGVLRTYDGGETWHQKFIGTHHFINDMIYNNNVLYGVTSGGEVIISVDKGENWRIYQINNKNLSKITKNNEFIFVISNSNEVLISSDLTINFEKIYSAAENTISELFVLNNRLFIKQIELNESSKNLLFVSDDLGITWQHFDLPNDKYENKFNVRYSEKRVVLFNDETFAEIKDDFSYDFNDVNERVIFDLAFNNDDYYFVNYNGDSVTFYIYHYSQNEKKIVSRYEHKKLGLTPIQYVIYNTCSDSKNLLVTTNQKTIIKFSQKGEFSEILSTYNRSQNASPYFLNSKDWYFSSELKYNGIGGNFIISNNQGKTYNFSKHFFYDTTRTFCRYNNAFPTNLFFDNNQNLIFSLKFSEVCSANYYPFSSYKTNQYLDHIEPFVEYSDIGPGDRKNLIINKNKSYILYYLHERDHKAIFYEINEENEITLLSEIDSINFSGAIVFLSFFFEGNDVYMIGYNQLPVRQFYIYKSKDDFKSWELILKNNVSIYEYPIGFYKSNNGKYYLMLLDFLESYKLVEIDIDSKDINIINYQETENESNGSHLIDYHKNEKFIFTSDEILEDMTFLHTTRTIFNNSQATFKRFNVKLSIQNDKIIIDTLINLPDDYKRFISQFDDFKLYMLNNNIFIPIEDTTLIKSAEKIKPPSIWTYPPYPNPVKDRLKMQFYSAIMSDIAKLKVELIHIGTGRSYQIDRYDLNVKDDYWGEIEIDVSGYIRGAYLINFKLGDGNKSESIIIE